MVYEQVCGKRTTSEKTTERANTKFQLRAEIQNEVQGMDGCGVMHCGCRCEYRNKSEGIYKKAVRIKGNTFPVIGREVGVSLVQGYLNGRTS